ncbi:MAG: 4'-phosphopantetheinyl transferase superfamily protein [Candidatus Dormibacteraeota bacterium]|nr:4'-phosphopantetheinyl transferase superfamily protein [Candidatus Dormibacteraeota bacterium]
MESLVELSVGRVVPPRSGEVQLWRASLDLDEAAAAVVCASLSADEVVRAERFVHEVDRRRFAVGRGWLRMLLGAYLDVAPAAVVVVRDERGKPRVGAGASTDGGCLRFNLAHSGASIVVAAAWDREVGVDVELVRAVDVEAIARRSLSTRQHAALMQLPHGSRESAFFATWTHNEAYLKGLGVGRDGGDHDVDGTPGWTVSAFDAGPGCAAAVAVEGGELDVPLVARELTPHA